MTAAAREVASEWCLKMAEGPLSPEEQVHLDHWLETDPENRAVFGRMAAVWLATPDTADLPEMIAVRADALESMRATNERRWSRKHIARRFWPVPALAVAVAAIMMAGFFLMMNRAESFRTGVGERQVVRLDDGSRLSLDAATKVDVAYSGDARTLHLLAGRAKFDVVHDPARPFSVTAGNRTVIATGTAFSVELVRGEMRVILYQGHVRVVTTGEDKAHPILLAGSSDNLVSADQALTPGKILIAALDRPVATVQITDPQRSLGWEAGQLNFTDDPLSTVVERINRYSNIPIVVEGAAASLPVSGTFNAGDTASFVDGVKAIYPLRIERRGGAIILLSEK